MVSHILDEGLLLVKTYYKNGENFILTIRKLHDHFVERSKSLTRHQTKRSKENIAAERDSVAERLNISIRHRCQELNQDAIDSTAAA